MRMLTTWMMVAVMTSLFRQHDHCEELSPAIFGCHALLAGVHVHVLV